MDQATNDGVLLGAINGVLHGGASVIHGKFGTALRINGNKQYVDYGSHLDECYHNPDKCTDGVTFALWLNVHAYNSIILDTGGMRSYSFGYWLLITSDGSIKVSVKDELMYHQYVAPDFPLNEWVHVLFTWTPSGTGLIHLYINGCDADATNDNGYAYNLARFSTITHTFKFVLGAGEDGSVSFANAHLDDIIHWDQVMGPLEVWQFYLVSIGM